MNFSILITDTDDEQAMPTEKPWRASLMIGAIPSPVEECVAYGTTPLAAVAMLITEPALHDLIASPEPEVCDDCGNVVNSVVWAEYHDSEGNCHAHRAPR